MNRVHYEISTMRHTAHLLDVTISISHPDAVMELKMPVWTPGSYMVREYARHVQAFRVVQDGQSCRWQKTDKCTWQIQLLNTDAPVEVRYSVYAYELTVRTNHVDDTHAFFNPAAVCMCLTSYQQPLHVRVQTPGHWRVATQLPTTHAVQMHADGAMWSFAAQSYDALYDAPFECGTHQTIEFFVENIPHEVVVWGHGNEDIATLVHDIERIVRAVRAHFAAIPYTRYTFILHLADGMYGGLEHCNSTVCLCDRWGFAKQRDYEKILGLITHEFFHTWNVKGPFNYFQENYTRQLWLAEGVTSYYDNLIMCRARLISPKRYLELLADDINSVMRTPGRLHQSLAEASFDAWIRYYRPDENSPNVSISYYIKGAVVTFALDMFIRRLSAGERSFDDVLRLLEARYPLEHPGIPEDHTMILLIAEVAGVDFDLVAQFFADYIEGTAEIDYAMLATVVGLDTHWDVSDDGPVTIGVRVKQESTRLLVASVTPYSPAADAGISPFDEIIAFNDTRVDAGRFKARLQESAPGTSVRITYFRRDELRSVVLHVIATPWQQIRWVRTAQPVSLQSAQYEQWLGIPVADQE